MNEYFIEYCVQRMQNDRQQLRLPRATTSSQWPALPLPIEAVAGKPRRPQLTGNHLNWPQMTTPATVTPTPPPHSGAVEYKNEKQCWKKSYIHKPYIVCICRYPRWTMAKKSKQQQNKQIGGNWRQQKATKAPRTAQTEQLQSTGDKVEENKG